MNDPRRLLDDATDLERELLEALRAPPPPPGAKERVAQRVIESLDEAEPATVTPIGRRAG